MHPYFKLDYMAMFWGGAKEQAKEQEAGNWEAKDWQDEALKVVERVVSTSFFGQFLHIHTSFDLQVEEYSCRRQNKEKSTDTTPALAANAANAAPAEQESDEESLLATFAHRCKAHTGKKAVEMWWAELCHYLDEVKEGVDLPDINVIKWWQVRFHFILVYRSSPHVFD